MPLTAPDPILEALYQQIRNAPPGTDLSALMDETITRYNELERGGVTDGGLPYPDPTDPISEGADAIRALAEALDPGRILFYKFTPVTMTLQINSGVVPNSAFPLSLKAGQTVVIRATANLNNSVSGGARTATLRMLKDAAAIFTNGVYAIPWVVGSTTTTCVYLSSYTAAADETFEMTLTAWANVANAVTFLNLQWEVIVSAPAAETQPAPDLPPDVLDNTLPTTEEEA
jgi:hypothetical protein